MKPRVGLLVLTAAMLMAGTAGPRAADSVRLLMVLLGGGTHDVEANPPLLESAIHSVGGIEVTKLAPPPGNQADGAHLAKLAELKPGDYDVLLFYTFRESFTPEQEVALQRFVDEGGGIVAIHAAAVTLGNSEPWARIIGARFAGHTPGLYPLTITVADTAHPIMKGIQDFEVADEEFTFSFPEDVERHVLARFKQRPPTTVEKNGNNDCVWTVSHGKGRAVYSSVGHGKDAWSNPVWQKMILQAVFWAAGKPREVTLTH